MSCGRRSAPGSGDRVRRLERWRQDFSPAVTSPARADRRARLGIDALGYDGSVQLVWLDGRNAAPRCSRTSGAGEAGARTAVARARTSFTRRGRGRRAGESSFAANVCFCCKTAVATFGERVFVAWRHLFPGGVRDIAVARSTDTARPSAIRLRVSEDNWKIDACPDDGPAMAADGHGGIHSCGRRSWRATRRGRGSSIRPWRETAFLHALRLDSGESDPAHPQTDAMTWEYRLVWDERAANPGASCSPRVERRGGARRSSPATARLIRSRRRPRATGSSCGPRRATTAGPYRGTENSFDGEGVTAVPIRGLLQQARA